jgi:D-serine deaminase-like pyridoxal phosphate-dependent protein
VTDLQVGSYVFMDQEYLNIGGRESPVFDDFEVSLTVATTAISQPMETAVTVDGGYKVFASDTVNPEPLDLADSRFRFAGDEHGVLLFPKGTQQPVLGSVQRFVTPHCDPTVNLHENLWIHRGEEVYARWPISARGCSW